MRALWPNTAAKRVDSGRVEASLIAGVAEVAMTQGPFWDGHRKRPLVRHVLYVSRATCFPTVQRAERKRADRPGWIDRRVPGRHQSCPEPPHLHGVVHGRAGEQVADGLAVLQQQPREFTQRRRRTVSGVNHREPR